MKITKLLESPRLYVDEKFLGWKNGWIPASMRRAKCIAYFVAAKGHPEVQRIIKDRYEFIFREVWPQAEVSAAESTGGEERLARNIKRETEEHKLALQNVLTLLKAWKTAQEYQKGEDFFHRLKTTVSSLDKDFCEPIRFGREIEIRREELRASSVPGHIEFDALLGFKQTATLRFERRLDNWGEINARLEESFRAGAWTRSSARAKMTSLGWGMDVQALVAIGSQLEVSGDLTWRGGDAGVALRGEARVFAGARAEGALTLSASATEGISAAIRAGAFVGFSAEVSGSCAFQYGDVPVLTASGSASIAFGVGGTFEAKINAPIFGPTEIGLKTEVALGLGFGMDATVGINFSQSALAVEEAFRLAIYLPTVMRGYRADLMNDEAKNLYYLNKAITAFESELSRCSEDLRRYAQMPSDRRALLNSMG